MNPKTLYALRLAGGPVARDRLAVHYAAPDGLEKDLVTLRRHALVVDAGDAVAWVGS